MFSILRRRIMGRKRANGQGCITKNKRNGKYNCTYTVSYNPKTKKSKRRTFTVDTYDEAEVKLAQIIQEIKEGHYKIEADMKFKDWITYWLDECKINTIEKTTFENYRGVIKNHIVPYLGNYRLKEISVKELQQFYNHLYEEGRDDGSGGLNPRSVQRIHTIINSSLKHAVRCEILNKNVATYVVKRKMKKFEVDPFSIGELRRFLEVTEDEEMYPLFVTSALTGMRRGEVLALTWENIDFEGRKIHIKYSISHTKKEGERFRVIELKDTKTESSRRVIPIGEPVVKVLRECKSKQLELSMKNGREGYNPHNLVFADKSGDFINPSKYTNHFREVIKRYNFRHIRLHDLRHGYATILLQEGADHKSIKDLLGHSTIVTTLDIYAHTNINELRKATDKLNGII